MRGYHILNIQVQILCFQTSPFFFDGSNLMGHVSNCTRASMISDFMAILIRVTHCFGVKGQTKRLTSDGTWTTQRLASLVWGAYLFFFLDSSIHGIAWRVSRVVLLHVGGREPPNCGFVFDTANRVSRGLHCVLGFQLHCAFAHKHSLVPQ